MRGGTGVVGFLALVVVAASATGSAHGAYSPRDLLSYRPRLPGVEYDIPTDPAAIDACKVETVTNAEKRGVGYLLRDGQGKILRRFVIANGQDHTHLDQWSYFQDGFEVYREDDLDGDQRLDECRWMNAGGSRIAVVKANKIKTWKRISPEEASKVLVQALVAADDDLLATVMATPEELKDAGLPRDFVEKAQAALAGRPEKLADLRKSLVGWTKQTVWNRFDGTYPHLIPVDPAVGLAKDLTLYENAMIFPTSTGPQQAAAKMAFLQIPDLIELGPVWKFVSAPRAIDPDRPVVAAADGLRSVLYDRPDAGAGRDEAMDLALKTLADYDAQSAPLLQTGDKEKIAQYHHDRIRLLRAVVKVAKSPEDQLNYNKQVVDSLIAALRTGFYPKGKTLIEGIVADGGKLASYAAYRLIEVDFAMKSEEPGSNDLTNQKKWMAELEAFLAKHPTSDEAPDALLQLASAGEFNADDDKAREQYGRLVKDYAASEAAKKAAGALKRMDLVGKSLVVKGPGLSGETIDSAQARGKTLLVVFWATWASPVRADLPELTKVYEKYHARGLEVIGVNLDNDRADVDRFLKEHKIPWPQIFEGGGMESRLAVEFGIFSLWTMFLVDSDGKVVTTAPRTAAELDRQLEKTLTAKSAAANRSGRPALDR